MHGSQGFQIVHSEFADAESTGLADKAGSFHKKEIIKQTLMILNDLGWMDGFQGNENLPRRHGGTEGTEKQNIAADSRRQKQVKMHVALNQCSLARLKQESFLI